MGHYLLILFVREKNYKIIMEELCHVGLEGLKRITYVMEPFFLMKQSSLR